MEYFQIDPLNFEIRREWPEMARNNILDKSHWILITMEGFGWKLLSSHSYSIFQPREKYRQVMEGNAHTKYGWVMPAGQQKTVTEYLFTKQRQ
jgi:hypothetical protein